MDVADAGKGYRAGIQARHGEFQIIHKGAQMKRYFAAYEPVAQEWLLVFSVVVRDEMAARPALLAMRGAAPTLRWTERGGWLEKEIAPQPPFEFLPTMLP